MSSQAAVFDLESLVSGVLDGDHRALARTISHIEDRTTGYRKLVSTLHTHSGDADLIGVTGSPGSGKSTLVNQLTSQYRDAGETVGVVAVDPSSPFSGGAVLGDRIRLGAAVGDPGVFVRSMSARGSLGGLSPATADAITAFDAFGIEKILVETVGAGQSEVEIVRTADTVAVLVPPSSGDDVQMLKAGILEIGDVFVVNKADLSGADRTVTELSRMLDLRDAAEGVWTPRIVETVADEGEGVAELRAAFADHRSSLLASGALARSAQKRYEQEIRTLLGQDAVAMLESEIQRRGGMETLAKRVHQRETDPYQVVDSLLDPIRERLDSEAT